MMPLVTIATATAANPLLTDVIESVHNQTYENIQHLIFIDGAEKTLEAERLIAASQTEQRKGRDLNVIRLPYSVGKDRWNGHRMYGAACYLAEGEYMIFLDDDNTLEPTHIEDCVKAIEGKQWSFSFRNIQDKNKNFICQDNCESLGLFPSVIHPQDFFVDVNCYLMRRDVAVSISPIWYRKFREPGQMEIDRAICSVLRQHFPEFQSTYKYTVNYTVGNTMNSVQADFFMRGNEEMLNRFGGNLPWKK